MSYLPYVIILALLGFVYLQDRQNRLERKDLLRLLKAKDLDEVTRAEREDKTEPEPDLPPDFQPVENLDDEAFLKAIGVKEE